MLDQAFDPAQDHPAGDDLEVLSEPPADLEAARHACPNRLDFARLLPEVERHLS